MIHLKINENRILFLKLIQRRSIEDKFFAAGRQPSSRDGWEQMSSVCAANCRLVKAPCIV
ncbi:hypothetical protein OKW12_001032 [Pseudomonas silensiensis]|nr:hypothetical protein [Pseudomonas silensiensis]